ncbi:MAG TPA: electron transport complex subunit RsxC [Bacteroidales bacterium]|nr:electron transport complex subunit RsxC [Bacteroidales bacterium]HQP16663.1 electron transport complex subunit RsxC [Bacteroidales bacterium]
MKTFKIGGVHPEENKISAGVAIKNLALPKTAVIPLSQSLGAPSVPIVNKGDKVLTGQLIAQGTSFISSNIHAPVSGTVSKIDDMMDASGYRRKAIIIDVEGDDWVDTIDRSQEIKQEITLSKEEIIACIKNAGIVGLGGATFPTHVKLMVPEGKKAEYLIINAVECEPYLTSDHRIMLEKGEEVMIGIKILMKALAVDRAYVGIENNKPDAIAHLSQLAEKYSGIKVAALKVKYPQGGEKQLIKALINREVPSGKLPIEVGCVVQNVGTAYAVYEAVQKNKPLIERVVTVTGKAIANPSNFIVRIGTPVSALLEAAGGIPDETGKVINGGPMMGKAVNSTEIPVVKGMSGLVLMPEKEAKRMKVSNCIRCAKCVSACPMGLAPYLIAQTSEIGQEEMAESLRVLDCIECGSCSFTCPSGRPLLENIRMAKNKVGQIIRSRAK